MGTAAIVLVALIVALTAAVVIAVFIWAAVKDGQEDRALQARLGIRRRTRLGR
jgi:ABC-type phosphate transport system permease subunit